MSRNQDHSVYRDGERRRNEDQRSYKRELLYMEEKALYMVMMTRPEAATLGRGRPGLGIFEAVSFGFDLLELNTFSIFLQ